MNNNSSTTNNIKRDNINIESHTISLEELISLKQLIFNLTEENLVFSTQQTMKFFDLTFPYSFNYIISNLVYFAFYSQHKEISIYVNYLQLIQNEEEIYKNIPKIIEFFCKYISEIKSQEAYYLIDKMIEYNLIHKDIIKSIKSKYFSHYRGKKENKKRKKFHDKFYKYYNDNYIKLSKNDWELHKQYIKEGFNPNEIAKIIRNDEIEKLQEISSQTNFDFNQIIEPSLYARCDFINQFNVTLIDYAAFFSSVKCFKHLLVNGANIENTCKYAIAGGNLEIIHLCEQNHSKFENTYETAIIFHRNDVFKYIYENKLEEKSDNDLIVYCINGGNYEILSFLEEKGMIINDNIINETAKIGNLYLLKHFLKNTKISKNISIFGMESGNVEMIKFLLEQNGIDINAKSIYFNNLKFQNNIWKLFKFFRTALMYASFNNHIEMVKLLLEQKGIDINAKDIYLFYLIFILIILYFKIIFGNSLNYLIQHL